MDLSLVSFSCLLWATFAALLISSLLFVFSLAAKNPEKYREQLTSFPFMKLPGELRNLVYDELACREIVFQSQTKPPVPSSIFSKFLSIFRRSTPTSSCNWLMLANRKVYGEFMSVLSKKGAFVFYIDQYNFEEPGFWPVSKALAMGIKKCEIRFILTANMLGAADPRFMPWQWPLRQRVNKLLQEFEELEHVIVSIQAIGNPLWNPLWIWYHASQSFKTAPGNKFDKIRFSLDSPSPGPGENQLVKKESTWLWMCPNGHVLEEDPKRIQQIREFCASLVEPCILCGTS